jgi:hypothetical protein
MDDLTDAQKKLVRLIDAAAKRLVREAFGSLRKDLDEVNKNVDRKLAHVEEALK